MKTKLMITAIASVAAMSATSASAQCNSEYVDETVYFNHDSSSKGSYETQIQNVINTINSCAGSAIQIVCHTDTSGSAVYNMGLSQRRAEQMFKDLIAGGVNSSQIISRTGEGETNNALPLGDGVKEESNRRCNIRMKNDLYAPAQTYTQPTETYTQPAQTYTETVVEQAPYQAPTPIESTQVVTQAPYQAPTPVTSTVPSTPVTSAPVTSAPYVPASAPPPLPPVSTGGGFLGGISTPVLIGGLAAVVAAGVLIADDDEPNSP